jgi:hypothetical protein
MPGLVIIGDGVQSLVPGGQQLAGRGVEEGGYHWNGELRLWDNELLMGWYAANEGSIRSKGTMYFMLHPHGLNMSGRWVGLGYDGRIMTGWAAMGQTQEEAEDTMQS